MRPLPPSGSGMDELTEVLRRIRARFYGTTELLSMARSVITPPPTYRALPEAGGTPSLTPGGSSASSPGCAPPLAMGAPHYRVLAPLGRRSTLEWCA
jgi:hypothetical protein